MSYVLIESQIFYRQPYLTQSISILSYGPCVFEFFWRSENASMAAFAPFRAHFSKSQWFHAIHLESQWSVFERVYSCKVQIFWKIHDQKCSFSLKPKKMLIGILKWYSRKTFPLGQLTWIVEFDVGMITFIAHFWKRKLDLIRQQNISTGIDQYLFLAGSFVFFRHYDLTHTALIRDFFHVCQRNWARGRTGYMLKLATTQKSRLAAQMTSAVHAKNHVEKKKYACEETIRIKFLRV